MNKFSDYITEHYSFIMTSTMINIFFMVSLIIGTLFLLLVLTVISNKKRSSYKKKLRIQMLLFIIETFLVTSIFSYILTSIEEGTYNYEMWIKKKNDFQILERFIFSLTVYQGIRFLFLKLKDGANYDSFISLKYYLDSLVIRIESGVPVPDEIIEELNLRIGQPLAMYNEETRDIWKKAYGYIVKYKSNIISEQEIIFILKTYARDLEHQANITNLIWMNSIFLRFTK
jgi:heme/copper-type cytochrome/quinol oxidase subunit 2